jgi:hypothetical protein
MKKIFIILFLFPIVVFGQNWQWARQAGGNASESYDGGNVVTDGSNYYLYGTFSGTMQLQTDTVNSLGLYDFYIIKYDNDGDELWVKAFGGDNGTDQFESFDIAYDSVSNNLYLTGVFYGTLQLDTINLTASTSANNFIAKMDVNGNFLWAKNAWIKINSNLISDVPRPSIYIRSDGIVYLFATLTDSALFDGITIAAGGCLAKFTSNGNCFSVRDITPPMQVKPNIGFLEKDLIMYANFRQTFEIDTATLVSNGDYDIFISRADSNGSIKWIKQFGFGSTDVISQVAIDNSNNIYVVAGFNDSISFDGHIFYNTTNDILLLKFNEDGNFIWGRQTNANGNIESANSIAVDGEGNCYITGLFSSSASFGAYTISTTNLFDMFLARYSTNGECFGVEHFGKADGSNVVIDNSGDPVCAGTFANTVTIGSSTFSSHGPFDIYLAKSDAFIGITERYKTSNYQLIIFANPTTGKCNITVPDDFMNEKNLTLCIFDNTGKRIQQKTLEMDEGKIRVDLEEEAKGIYNVTLGNGKKVYGGRIVFQ